MADTVEFALTPKQEQKVANWIFKNFGEMSSFPNADKDLAYTLAVYSVFKEGNLLKEGSKEYSFGIHPGNPPSISFGKKNDDLTGNVDEKALQEIHASIPNFAFHTDSFNRVMEVYKNIPLNSVLTQFQNWAKDQSDKSV